MRCLLIQTAILAALVLAPTPMHAESVGILTLDMLSFIAFGDEPAIPLPSGSTIVFHFSEPSTDGSIAFTIHPEGVVIPTVASSDGSVLLKYTLKNTASGTISAPGPSGRVISFTGTIAASVGDGDANSFSYSLPFTTETVAATDTLGANRIEVTGLRLVEGIWYAQLVGATTNRENAVPAPGTAVYSVLSGRFDQLPVAE